MKCILIFLDDHNNRSDLIEYQPFNNNLDLNDLLQNVGEELDHQGENSSFLRFTHTELI